MVWKGVSVLPKVQYRLRAGILSRFTVLAGGLLGGFDALMASGYRVHLANTAAIVQYSGLKYADARATAGAR